MKRLLVVWFGSICLVCASVAFGGARGDSTVKYDMLAHLMVVEASISGSQETYNFVIDTGGVTFIDKTLADTLGLKQQGMMAKIDTPRLKTFPIEKVFCFTTFDFGLFDALGTPIHGIIGSNLLERYRVTFDFAASSVAFSSDTTAIQPPEDGLLLAFANHMVNNAPMVEFTIGDRSMKGMIDTGQPHPVVLPLQTFDDYEALCLPAPIRSRGLMEEWPMTTADHNYLARLQSVTLGHVKFDSIMCLFGELPEMLSVPLVGMDFLSRFRIVIDYPNDEMLMVPYDDLDLVPNVFTVGINPDISPDGDITIKGLWEGSPADRAGLEVGDVILSFNGREVTPSNLVELMKLLEDDAATSITLGIAEGETTRTLRIEKAWLF